MCKYYHHEYFDNEFHHSDFYTNCSVVSKLNSTAVADKLNEYTGDNRYMESGNNKYGCYRNNDLYIYTCNWSMCQYHHNGYCDNEFHHFGIYTDRTVVSKLNSTAIAHKLNEYTGDNWYMESGNN